MKRPVGITILALLSFINVATYGALLALAVFDPPALASVLKGLSPGGAGPEMQLKMGTWLPLYYATGMLATLLVGLGFWKLWNWTRLVVLAMIGVSAVTLFSVEAASLWRTHSGSGLALWLFRLGLCAFFAWYLTSRKVRGAFRRDDAQPLTGSAAHAS